MALFASKPLEPEHYTGSLMSISRGQKAPQAYCAQDPPSNVQVIDLTTQEVSDSEDEDSEPELCDVWELLWKSRENAETRAQETSIDANTTTTTSELASQATLDADMTGQVRQYHASNDEFIPIDSLFEEVRGNDNDLATNDLAVQAASDARTADQAFTTISSTDQIATATAGSSNESVTMETPLSSFPTHVVDMASSCPTVDTTKHSAEPIERKRSLRKASTTDPDSTRPLGGDALSKRPRREITKTWKARDADRMVEPDDGNASGYACPRQRLNWRVKDLDSVHLAKDGSIQCTVIWEPTVVAKADLVGAALHNRCEELFKETYGEDEWKKWLTTHCASKQRRRKMGAK